VLWHRVGSVRLGEASVAVVVSAPHRGDALEACRYLIDTLKATVPIWKREHWPGGAEWSPASQPLREIGEERALQAAESRGRRPR
jgi:molybdopterin synthase catalytic subunit